MRAVLDPNVIVSAVLSRSGTPAKVLRAWLTVPTSWWPRPVLLAELQRVLEYPKIASRVSPSEAAELLDLLRRQARLVADPESPPTVRSPDPGDDYLISLAEAAQAVIVSGDADLQNVADRRRSIHPPRSWPS